MIKSGKDTPLSGSKLLVFREHHVQLSNYRLGDILALMINLVKLFQPATFQSVNSISQSVQSLSCVQLFATSRTVACQASLSITNSQSLLKLMSIESVMPSNHLILCRPLLSCPQSFPASGSFQMSQLFSSAGQSIGVSASASVLPMNIQGWFPLGWTGWISLQSKGLSRVFSNTTVQKHQFFSTQPSSQSNSHIHLYMTTGKTIALTRQTLAK